MQRYLLIVLFLAFLTCACTDAPNSTKETSKSNAIKEVEYALFFRKFTTQYFGANFDHKWFVSQARAESAMNPDATSPVGAKGLMQVMPSTFRQIKSKIDVRDITDPVSNIQAGIYYDKTLYVEWTAPRPFKHRMAFTFASYNAGLNNILKGQAECQKSKCETCNLWSSVKQNGSQVDTWRQKETIAYVDRIFRFMDKELH